MSAPESVAVPTLRLFPRWVIAVLAICPLLLAMPQVAGQAAHGQDDPVLGPVGTTLAPIGNVPVIHPTDPHRLRMGTKIFFPVGHYGASMTMTNNNSSWGGNPEVAHQYFVNKLYANGLNYMRTWINWGNVRSGKLAGDWDYHMVHPYLRTGPGNANDGQPKFDLNQWNQAYFDLLKREVDYAKDRGIVLQVILFDCWHVASSTYLVGDYYYGANNINGINATTGAQWTQGPGGPAWGRQVAFMKKVVRAIGDRPNIIWETCNENFNNPAFDSSMAYEITVYEQQQYLPVHLVMPRDLPNHWSVAGYMTPANSGQESIEAMHNRLRDVQFAWNKPLISDNDCCSNTSENSTFRRQKLWAALTAGAHVDFFKDGLPIQKWMMDDADITLGMQQYGYVLRFLSSLNVKLVNMRPRDDLVTNGWCYAKSGNEYIIYLINGGSTTVSSLPAYYNATWYNPRTNATSNAGLGPTFSKPTGSDWVLYIKKQ